MTVDGLFSKLNPLFRAWLELPILHWGVSPGLLLFHVVGRRSGVRYSIPVGYQRIEGGDAVAITVSEAAGKQWWRNYRDPEQVDLLLRGRARSGVAYCVDPADPAFHELAEQTLRRVPGMARVFHVDFDRKRGLTPDQVAHLGQEIAIVRVDLDPG